MIRRSFLKSATAFSFFAARPISVRSQALAVQPSAPTCTNELPCPNKLPCPDAFAVQAPLEYFNTGGLGPALKVATAKQMSVIQELQPRVERGHKLIKGARTELAKFLGCSEKEVAFTRNATEGNSTIASGLKLSEGDEIIIDSHAHQGGSVAWMTRQLYENIVVKAFEPSAHSVQENLDRIASLITPRTKAIQVSHVTAPTGIRMPVAEIAKMATDNQIWFHIDGAQSAGMFPIQMKEIGCDSFAACGHKWLCGPIGTGFMYIKEGRIDEVQPTEVGDHAEKDWQVPSLLTFRPEATRFECGTRDPASIIGLIEATKFQLTAGRTAIASHSFGLANELREQLLALPKIEMISPSNERLASAMVSFRVKGQHFDRTFGKLWNRQFRCRPVREQGIDAVRISTHMFNTREQCDRLLAEIKTL